MAARRGLDGRFISKEASQGKPYMVVDSIGRKQNFFNGKRISEKLFSEFKVERRQKADEPNIGFGGDPGTISGSGHYHYTGDMWATTDGETVKLKEQLDPSEIVPKSHRGADGFDSHIKEFPAKGFESVESLHDAAFQIAADPALGITPANVVVKSVTWNPSTEQYDVEYFIDFSTAYGKKE